MQLMDFANEPEKSRVAINDWVSDRTNEKIKDLLPERIITPKVKLVLTNAIYFNAGWADAFDESETADGPFLLLDGSEVTVPMMRQTTSLGYGQGEGYQVVELPYDGDELSMVILLPDEGGFSAFENSLDSSRIVSITNRIDYQEVALTMPKFKIESDFSLKHTLKGMGMPGAFLEGANFSGMDGSRNLFISDVIHKAFVDVNESGTEAAAATAVIMVVESVPPPPIEVTVDRPFILFIRDIETSTILFAGRVVDPSP
jgi:serpin B